MRLYDYWRSSAAYRVRIALGLKGVAYEQVPVDLRRGAQGTPDHLCRHPQGLVPALDTGTAVLTQSLAIVEWLDETRPEPPLLPKAAADRAVVRALALHIACEIHPLNNLRVLRHLKHGLGLDQEAVEGWYRHWVGEGFAALERRLAATAGCYSFGDRVTMADLCLVPQVYNAGRYGCDLTAYPVIVRVDAACRELPAFAAAEPERQPDALS